MIKEHFKNYRHPVLRLSAIVALVVITMLVVLRHSAPPAPNFKNMPNHERKSAFIHYMLPLIHKANDKILSEREVILALKKKLDEEGSLSKKGYHTLHALYKQNKLGNTLEVSDQDFKKLLNRVDIIPPSLALAQAALESGSM